MDVGLIFRVVNYQRITRVVELIFDFRTLKHHIVEALVNPEDLGDYDTLGREVLRECAIEAQGLLNSDYAGDTRLSRALQGGPEEQKAELQL
jgi:hypothetical protein